MENIWFDSWESIMKIIFVTPLAYLSMIVLLRISGKRTLSKMNAFDFIVTIALGSTLSSLALNKSIPFVNGITAILLFIGLQFLLTWLSVRMKVVKTIITAKPTLIFYKGNFLKEAMQYERVTVEEIYSAARQKGFSTLDNIDLIVFETTGDFAIIEKSIEGKKSSIEDVKVNP